MEQERVCKAKGRQHGEKEQEGTAVRDKEMKKDIMGEKALRGRGAVCPSIIICWVVSRKKLHQTAQGNFFPSLCACICFLCPIHVMRGCNL